MATFACSLNLLFSLITLISLYPFVGSIYFKVPRFNPDDPKIQYQGDAKPYGGGVELNDEDYLCHTGWVTYAENIPFWNSNTGKVSDFTTRFSFTIDTRNGTNFAAGLAFFLAPVGFQIPPNSVGGYLGLYNTTTTGSPRNQIVHVEFDTFYNSGLDPTDVKSHVGINVNSLSSSAYTSWNASSHSKDPADTLITYNATTKNLSVSWSYRVTSDPQENSSLSYTIDLEKILPEWVIVGFSASTSGFTERHTLESWEFNSTLDRKDGDGNPQKIWIVVGASVLGFLVIAFAVFGFAFLRWRKHKAESAEETMNLTSINEDLERGAGPRKFSYLELGSATNNFSDERKLGEGGFGSVYKGYLNDTDMMVAVKKISRDSKQGKKEFITEVKIISSLRHRNLVQLIGWCHEQDEFLLVYELMPNGSLDSHLFGKIPCLSWGIRYKISLGIASALLYLHEEWEQCVIHRDIKASNIMLDSNFNVKLGDFGLARLMDHELGPQTTGLAGTFGYMAPEYISTGRASKESDVHSFGVVVLEIVTGKRPVSPSKGKYEPAVGLVEFVWDLYGRQELLSAIDEKLAMEFDQKQAECLMVVGLWCAHPDRSSRPSIKQAIQVMNFDMPMPNLPPKLPVPTYYLGSTSSASVSSASAAASVTFSSAQAGR